MKKIPAIKTVMTPFPYWIDVNAPLSQAEEMMLEHDISHLPVKEEGTLTAVISRHDMDNTKSDSVSNNDAASMLVKDVCVFTLTKR